jgi:hypothetical protein
MVAVTRQRIGDGIHDVIGVVVHEDPQGVGHASHVAAGIGNNSQVVFATL